MTAATAGAPFVREAPMLHARCRRAKAAHMTVVGEVGGRGRVGFSRGRRRRPLIVVNPHTYAHCAMYEMFSLPTKNNNNKIKRTKVSVVWASEHLISSVR